MQAIKKVLSVIICIALMLTTIVVPSASVALAAAVTGVVITQNDPRVVITSVLLFKSISYYVICQICFCIRKHLCVLISFFLLKSLGSCLLYT